MSKTTIVCAVCGNNSIDNFGPMYYRFPNCPERRDKWIHLLNLDKNNVKSSSRVCQLHFPKSQIVRVNLIKNALPKNLRKPDNSQLLQYPISNVSIGIVGWVINGNVNVGRSGGTNERLLQAKPNVSVEDEGLEKAVICNNKSIRGGQKPSGELCLICAELPDPLETNQPPLASDLLSFLNPHLWSMFILKLLNFPKDECENVFTKTFGVNPGEWFRLCGPCFQIVEQAFTLEQEVAKLQKKLERVKLSATKKLEESLKLDKCSTAKKKIKDVFDISKYIRQVFKDTPAKQLMESESISTIKVEDESEKVKDCVNFSTRLNEDVGIGCNNEDDDVASVKVEDEDIKVEVSPFLADSGNDNLETATDDAKRKYTDNNKINRKIAKKLKRTAIKRCRWSESQEQKPLNKNTDNTSRSPRILPTRLTCSLCPAKFIRNFNLKLHLDIHKKYKDTSCPKCNFPCITPKKLKRHLTLKRCTFQGQGSSLLALSSASHDNHEKCHICGRIYPSKIQMAKHLRNHRLNKKRTCPKCKLPCDKNKFENHIKICNLAVASSNANSSQVAEFKCDLCGYTTDYPYVFSKHRRIHEQAKFNCEVCSYPSLSWGWLKIHMKEIHDTVLGNPPGHVSKRRGPSRKKVTSQGLISKKVIRRVPTKGGNEPDKGQEIEMLSCHLCPALFSSIAKVNCHVRMVHQKSFSCSECDSTFEHQSHLRYHLLEKHGLVKNAFICDTCGMQFSGYSAWFVHKKKFHSNLVSNDKSTSDNAAVSKYERKCPHCKLTCCNTKALKNHLRANHPELYKYKCDLCPLTYISSTNLKIHVKNVHLKDEVECDKCKAKMKGSSMRDHLKRYCKFRSQANDIHHDPK